MEDDSDQEVENAKSKKINKKTAEKFVASESDESDDDIDLAELGLEESDDDEGSTRYHDIFTFTFICIIYVSVTL